MTSQAAARRAAGRRGRGRHPGHRLAATSRTSAPSRCGCPGGETVYAIPELPKEQRAPEDHLRRVLRRLGGRGGPLRQPRRAAHPAGLGPRRRLGPRPLRPARACSAPSPATTRSSWSWRPSRRRRGHGRSASATWPASDRPADPPEPRPKERTNDGEASGPRLQRWSRHVRGRALDDRELRRRGHRRGRRRRPGAATGRAVQASGARRRCGRGRSWSTAARSSPDDFLAPVAARPTPSTRAATRSCRRCRGPVIVRTSWPPPATTAPTPWPTAAPARATTRCASRSSTRALAPDLEVLAPVRDVGHDPRGLHRLRRRPRHPDRGDARRSCTPSTTTSGAGPSSAARWRTRGPCRPQGVWRMTTADGDRAPRRRRRLRGRACPVALDGEPPGRCTSSSSELNDVVGAYGWGRLDMVENRRVGIKSRETYESPGAPGPDRWPTRTSSRSRLERDLHAREAAARAAATPSWSTTACGSRR